MSDIYRLYTGALCARRIPEDNFILMDIRSQSARDRTGPILPKDREEWGVCNSRPRNKIDFTATTTQLRSSKQITQAPLPQELCHEVCPGSCCCPHHAGNVPCPERSGSECPEPG